MGRWGETGDGEMGRWGDGEMGRWVRFVGYKPCPERAWGISR
ncbi:hypothetical protein [Moorena sp. SIO3I6]|nr:hypothetical protein [Moorena sp. SIO3I6]